MNDTLQYYFSCTRQILSNDTKNVLTEFCYENVNQFVAHPLRRCPGKFSGNDFIRLADIPSSIRGLLQGLRTGLNIDIHPMLAKQDPKRQVERHTDQRTSVLIIPLYPTINFDPTLFWADFESELPVAQCNYDNSLPALLNTQKIHSVNNTSDDYRFALQIDLPKLTYESALDLLTADQLINVV
jgi:hypothetical protein